MTFQQIGLYVIAAVPIGSTVTFVKKSAAFEMSHSPNVKLIFNNNKHVQQQRTFTEKNAGQRNRSERIYQSIGG